MSRIAFVLTQDRGGPADVTLALARGLVESREHEIRVFGPPFASDPAWSDGHLIDVRVNEKTNFAAARRMRAALRSWAPDIVHAQDRRSGLVTCGIDHMAGRPLSVVHTYHGVPDDTGEPWFSGRGGATPPSLRSRVVLAADAVLARTVNRIVVPSSTMGSFLTSRLRVPAHKIVHIDNGVYLPVARPLAAPIRRLLFIGLLVPRKGLADILLALQRPGVMPADATLTVAGDGPSRAEAETLAVPLGGRVRFLGYRADVADLLSSHDAVVLPSRMEQQPLVIAQAMGAGRPVLATRTGGVPKMVEIPGVPTYLAEPGDVDSLSRALARLFDEPDAARLGESLSARARLRYSIEACVNAHLDLYSGILAERHRANDGGRHAIYGTGRR